MSNIQEKMYDTLEFYSHQNRSHTLFNEISIIQNLYIFVMIR